MPYLAHYAARGVSSNHPWLGQLRDQEIAERRERKRARLAAEQEARHQRLLWSLSTIVRR